MENRGEAPGKQQPRCAERRTGEDELRNTRRKIAENTWRVNYFIGTVRMICGKIAEVPTLRQELLACPELKPRSKRQVHRGAPAAGIRPPVQGWQRQRLAIHTMLTSQIW